MRRGDKSLHLPLLPKKKEAKSEMGGDKRLHLPLLSKKKEAKPEMPPKGCLGIRVGLAGEELQRFVVSVNYFQHPIFMGLLKKSEEEYGFQQKGTIIIPCQVEHFRQTQGIIDSEIGDGNKNHHYHLHHHNFLMGCFCPVL